LPSVPSLSGEILFKHSKTADEKDAKGDEVENKRESDMLSSQFLQLLQSSIEMKNCKYANSFCIYREMLDIPTLFLIIWLLTDVSQSYEIVAHFPK
jgi:hypothetical protein